MDLEKEIRKFETKINASNYTKALSLINNLKTEIIKNFDDEIYYYVEEYGSNYSLLFYISEEKPNFIKQTVWKDFLGYLRIILIPGKKTVVFEDPDILYRSSRGLVEDPIKLKITKNNDGKIFIKGMEYYVQFNCLDNSEDLISLMLDKLNELIEKEKNM